jgi:hypothetical protein
MRPRSRTSTDHAAHRVTGRGGGVRMRAGASHATSKRSAAARDSAGAVPEWAPLKRSIIGRLDDDEQR